MLAEAPSAAEEGARGDDEQGAQAERSRPGEVRDRERSGRPRRLSAQERVAGARVKHLDCRKRLKRFQRSKRLERLERLRRLFRLSRLQHL